MLNTSNIFDVNVTMRIRVNNYDNSINSHEIRIVEFACRGCTFTDLTNEGCFSFGYSLRVIYQNSRLVLERFRATFRRSEVNNEEFSFGCVDFVDWTRFSQTVNRDCLTTLVLTHNKINLWWMALFRKTKTDERFKRKADKELRIRKCVIKSQQRFILL